MKIVIPVIALSALIASGVSAWSGSPSTGSLQIKMKIDKECTVNPGGDTVLDFGTLGTITAKQTAAYDTEASIQVRCTSGVSYQIGLDAGLYPVRPGATYLRRLKSTIGETYIYYSLISPKDPKDPATTNSRWGNNFLWDGLTPSQRGDTDPTVSGEADGTLKSHRVIGTYSFIGVYGQDVPVGTYTDTVKVTVQF